MSESPDFPKVPGLPEFPDQISLALPTEFQSENSPVYPILPIRNGHPDKNKLRLAMLRIFLKSGNHWWSSRTKKTKQLFFLNGLIIFRFSTKEFKKTLLEKNFCSRKISPIQSEMSCDGRICRLCSTWIRLERNKCRRTLHAVSSCDWLSWLCFQLSISCNYSRIKIFIHKVFFASFKQENVSFARCSYFSPALSTALRNSGRFAEQIEA